MRRIIIVLCICLLLAGVYWYYLRGHSNVTVLKTVAVPVTTVLVKTGDIPLKISAIGSLDALNSVDISSPAAGKIKAIYFKNGDVVKASQALIQLDNTLLKANVDAAQSALQYDQTRLNRYKNLQKSGGGASLNDIDEITSSLKQNQAMLAIKQAELEQATIRAPFSGQLENRHYSNGAYIAAGAALVSLVDLNHITVDYNVPGQLIAQLKLGQAVKITSNGYPDKIFHGEVSYVSPTVEAQSNTIKVSAKIDNSSHLLHPGMFVEIEQQLGVRKNVVLIPEQSVVASIAGLQVYVINHNKAQLRKIKTGVRTTRQLEVTAGLHAGEQIAIDGQQSLSDGRQVQVQGIRR